jgi:hypothetical protein
MTLIDCLRAALRKRGFIEADDPKRAGVMHVTVWGTRDGAACSLDARWVGEELFRSFADRTIEARGCMIDVGACGDVEHAEITTVSCGDIRVDAHEEEAAEIVEDWTSEGGHYDPSELEYWLVYSMLEMDRPSMEIENLAFAYDRTLPKLAEPIAETSFVPEPGPWKRFAHPDGRRWAVRERHDGYDVQIVDEEGEVFTKARAHDRPRNMVALLISDQIAAGFMDDISTDT